MKAFILLMGLAFFLMVGCAGAPAGGGSGSASNNSGKGLTKEQLKQMGVEENKGYY